VSDGSIFYAIGAMIDSAQTAVTTRRNKITRAIGSSRLVTRAWEKTYGKWMDPGERVIRVVDFRTALIDKRGQRSCRTAIFWPFKGL
jgi:hypothetical protein